MARAAILAVFMMSAAVGGVTNADPPETAPPVRDADSPPPQGEPAAFEPIRVRFRLTDGVRITGELTTWDGDGIDGSFGRRRWSHIDHEDVWRLYPRLAGDGAARTWVDLGRLLLVAAIDEPRAEKWADRAFRRAIGIDAAAEAAVADARDEVAAIRRDRRRARAEAKAQRLVTASPEAQAWGNTPWPALTDAEQASAVLAMRHDAAAILDRAGLQLVPVETEFFLFYSDMPRRETARWASELDDMYRRLARTFDLPPDDNIFWGKAVIFVFSKRDRFELVEAESFGQLAPKWANGMCHPVGPKVFVSFYRPPDELVFAVLLVHETVHGFMHRYRTPRRLPVWANEGFADYLASILFRNSPVDLERRRKGVRYVRGGNDVNAILDLSYDDDTWPGRDAIGYSVGYLLVELMISDRPQAFGRWVDAVKAGKPWEQALEEDFGVTRTRLVETFVRYYTMND